MGYLVFTRSLFELVGVVQRLIAAYRGGMSERDDLLVSVANEIKTYRKVSFQNRHQSMLIVGFISSRPHSSWRPEDGPPARHPRLSTAGQTNRDGHGQELK